MKANQKATKEHMTDRESAVSPIVATLVLIVVAVVGAVAVGTIMGTFSTQVGSQANTGEVSSASSTEILIAGSTTVYPASVKIAADYENQHPGMKITVQQGGSGAGVTSAAMKIADIGAISSLKTLTDAQSANPTNPDYQNLIPTQIGGAGVVFASGTAANGGDVASPLDKDDLIAAYTSGACNAATGAFTAGSGSVPAATIMLQRSDVSGTEETVADYLLKAKNVDSSGALAVNGNEGVIARLQAATDPTLGFVDWGYASAAGATIKVNTITDGANTYTGNSTTIKNSLKDLTQAKAQDSTGGAINNYPQGLVRGLYYVTNGAPSSTVQSFIDYARTPTAASQDIDPVGMFGITEFA